MRVRSDLDETSLRERSLLFSELVSSFPKCRPSLHFGSLRPQAHITNFLCTDTAITNNDGLFRQSFIDRQKGRSMKVGPFLSRHVMAVFESIASFSPQSFPTHGKRLGRRRHVGLSASALPRHPFWRRGRLLAAGPYRVCGKPMCEHFSASFNIARKI